MEAWELASRVQLDLCKHDATVMKGLEKLFNMQFENPSPKLLFALNSL